MPYSQRITDRKLDELLPGLPAIVLEGAKGVGKTATAMRRAKTIRTLDDPAQAALTEANLAWALTGKRPVLLDEWQRIPSLWDAVRRRVDEGCGPGAFLLTGSSAPATPPMHSGAGRIVSIRMRPMTLLERGCGPATVSLGELLQGQRPPIDGHSGMTIEGYVEEVLRSGFPGMRKYTGRLHRAQLDNYLAQALDKDFVEQGIVVRNQNKLARWLRAYAAATATTAAWETIRDAATGEQADKPAKKSTLVYRDALEKLWILDPVAAWLPTRNHLKRLGQPPKHHLADPALAARILGMDQGALVGERVESGVGFKDGAFLGQLFESLVTLDVRVYAQAAEANVKHLRQQGGRHEIDLIVERSDQRVVAIEVKLGSVVEDKDVRHLKWLGGEIGEDLLDAIVITTGSEAYRRKDGIGVVPAALLGP